MKKLFIIFSLLPAVFQSAVSQIVTDIDGNVYQTVTVGTQVWMKENLKTTRLSNGTRIQNVPDSLDWCTMSDPAMCYYNNDSQVASVYGALYNGYTIFDPEGICPNGWHVPSESDWFVLEDLLGGQEFAGGVLKEQGTQHWADPNTGATDSIGFKALPGGMRKSDATYDYQLENGLWWTSSATSGSIGKALYMWNMSEGIFHNAISKRYGFSVRCVYNYPSGVEGIKEKALFQIYPNPFMDYLTVSSEETEFFQVIIRDLAGRVVFREAFTPIRFLRINLEQLNNGTYLIEVTGNTGISRLKMVKA